MLIQEHGILYVAKAKCQFWQEPAGGDLFPIHYCVEILLVIGGHGGFIPKKTSHFEPWQLLLELLLTLSHIREAGAEEIFRRGCVF